MGNCAGKVPKEKVSKSQQPKQQQPQQAEKATVAAGNNSAHQQPQQPKKEPVVEKPKTTTTTTTASTGSSSSFNGSKTIQVPKELHKYIIGTKGATVKDIKAQSGAHNIEVGSDGGDGVTVSGSDEAQVDQAISLIRKEISHHKTQDQKDHEYKEMREDHEKESQRTEAMYKKYQGEIDALADKREKLQEEANRAYESGNKDKARELREQAKHITTQMEEANKKASREIFNDKNKHNDKFTVDLHGLKTKDALELMDERLTELKKDSSNSGKKFTVITGAGNHSDENGPKIKPLIHQTFKERGIKFEEVNNGSIQCTI